MIDFKESYCDEHKHLRKESIKLYESKRYERDKQFIKFYNSSVWKDTRKSIMLRANGLCQYCLAEGTIQKAEVVDHYIPIKIDYEKRLDNENLVASCIRHNTLKEKDESKLRDNEMTLDEFKKRWPIGE